MNQYDDKLNELIKEANENGYIYKNNGFKKFYKETVDVVHLFIVSNKNELKVYNKCLVIIDKYVINKIKTIKNSSDIISFINHFVYKLDGCDISKIKDFKKIKEANLYNIDISNKKNIYGENSILETSFSDNKGLFGFLQIFKCPYNALDNFQNLKYILKQN